MHRKSLITVTWAALFVLASAAGVLSQVRARVDLVVVPVSVRDNNGFLVSHLERDDFKVSEDGQLQELTNFSVDPQPLSAAIVIDDGISGSALKRLVPLLQSLATEFTPDDEMTSFRYDHFVWRLSDFTNDRQQIVKSFSDLSRIAATRPDEPEQPALYRKIEEKTPAVIKALAGILTLGSIGAPSTPSTPSTAPAATRPRPAPDSRIMHSAIYDAAMALRDRPEKFRKIILLVSDGEVAEPQISIIPGKTVHSLDRNLELLVKDEVQVYAVNPPAGLLDRPSGVLNSYAETTGGDVYGGESESDMKFAFSRIAEQARTQYVLGYVSSNRAPRLGVYRKIEVKAGERELKLRVTHRRGYIQYPIPK